MFEIERSGYYAWISRTPSHRAISNQALDQKILTLFDRHHGRYGAKRLTLELHDQGEICGKNRVANRIKQLNLRAQAKKKFKVTTDSNHPLPVSRNLLNRDFNATRPNQK